MATPKHKILVVDDEASFTRLLKLNLEQTGRYTVQVENRATAAMASATRFEPDLILLDVMMPEMDGGELATLLRAHPKLHAVPIVFLTAAVKPEEVARNNGIIGGMPFLAKPVELEDLLECLRGQLSA